MASDAIALLVRRLARPHGSGGMVIERSVILAEGTDSAAILSWISDHDGVADFTTPPSRGGGLHSSRAVDNAENGLARRFVLPARAFDGLLALGDRR